MMSDPIEDGITARLLVGPVSATEIAAELGLPGARVRRRLRRLMECGLIVREGETRRRGVVEHLYSMSLRRGILHYGESLDVPERIREQGLVRLLRVMFRAAIGAVDSGTYYRRDEFAVLRFPLPLDGRGWVEARRIQEELVLAIIEVVERSNSERRGEDPESISAEATVLFFEAADGWMAPKISEEKSGPVRWSSSSQMGRHRALTDPLRWGILDALSLGPAGAADIAERCGAPIDRVRYELKRFKSEETIEVRSRRRRRGTEEIVYSYDPRKILLIPEEVSGSSKDDVEAYCREAVTKLFRHAIASMRAGTFHGREDHVLVRLPMRVDSATFVLISDLITGALYRLIELREQCLRRYAGREGELRPAFGGLLLFESAPG